MRWDIHLSSICWSNMTLFFPGDTRRSFVITIYRAHVTLYQQNVFIDMEANSGAALYFEIGPTWFYSYFFLLHSYSLFCHIIVPNHHSLIFYFSVPCQERSERTMTDHLTKTVIHILCDECVNLPGAQREENILTVSILGINFFSNILFIILYIPIPDFTISLSSFLVFFFFSNYRM